MAHPGRTVTSQPRKAASLGPPAALTPEDLLEMYATMVLARALDQRAWALNRQGKAAIVASCQGHEAAQIGAAWAMRQAASAAYFIYYRDLALALALGVTPREAMLAYLARAGETFSGGRQMPLHGARPDLRVYNISNVVGPHVPQAVGYALGCQMSGDPTVTLATFGDGATSEGDVHEGMNFATIHKLPVIFLCENNSYAISVPQRLQMAAADVADRAVGYGIPGVVVDGTDVLATYQATREAGLRAMRGEGPTLIEAKVERLLPHTSDDDDRRYRPAEEIEEARKRDPLKLFHTYLVSQGVLTEEMDQRLRTKADDAVNRATVEAEADPQPEAGTLYDHVYGS